MAFPKVSGRQPGMIPLLIGVTPIMRGSRDVGTRAHTKKFTVMMWEGQTRGEASERKAFFFKFSHLAQRVVRGHTTVASHYTTHTPPVSTCMSSRTLRGPLPPGTARLARRAAGPSTSSQLLRAGHVLGRPPLPVAQSGCGGATAGEHVDRRLVALRRGLVQRRVAVAVLPRHVRPRVA